MAYFAIYDETTGWLSSIGITPIEDTPYKITESEYNRLSAYLAEKSAYVQAVYNGETAIDDVPEEFREEVAAEVEAMRAADAEQPEEPMNDGDEALNIIKGVIE